MSASLDIETLFTLHQGELVGRLTKIVHCADIATDLTQESFLILTKTAKSQTIQQPRGFLFRVATNLAFDYLKHNKVIANHVEKQGDSYLQESPSAEHVAIQQQRLDLFKDMVNELPPRCRDVFILYKVQGKSYKEIAAELNISQSGVEKHIMKGLKHFRKKIVSINS